MALKCIMVVPPSERVPGLLATVRGFFVGQERGVLRSVQLLSAKVIESSVNYGVMGFTSVYTYAALRRLMGDELDNGKR